MERFNQLLFLGIMAICMIFQSNRGFAQFSGEYQSAKMVGKGKTELTAHYNGVRIGYEGESEFAFHVLGFQTGFGLSDNFELRVRYDRLWFKEAGIGDGFSVVSVAPKFGTKSGKFAFMIPVSTAFSSGGESDWLLSPSLLFTLPLAESVSLTFIPKYIISLEENSDISDSFLSLNVGLGIDFQENWIVRPEIGYMFIPGEKGNFFIFGLGISRVLGKSKQ